MKHILIVIGLLAMFTQSAICQTNAAIGGAGVCVVDQDPDLITDMQTQDIRYECMLAWDEASQTLYVYDNTLASGARWVDYSDGVSPIQSVTGGDGMTVTLTGQVIDVDSDEYTQGSYKNHADAGTGGVPVGGYFEAATANTMGVSPGTKVKRLF